MAKRARKTLPRARKKIEGKKKDGGNKQSSYQSYNKDKKTAGCFICESPHSERKCPKREKVSALIAETSDDGVDESPLLLMPLQLLNAITTEKESP